MIKVYYARGFRVNLPTAEIIIIIVAATTTTTATTIVIIIVIIIVVIITYFATRGDIGRDFKIF